MNIDKLRQDLEIDEGIKHEVYLDHLNLKTVGIGHLCRQDEPEYEMQVGTPVSDERVQQLFERDLDMVRLDCLKLYPDFDTLPEDAKQIIANMMFNSVHNPPFMHIGLSANSSDTTLQGSPTKLHFGRDSCLSTLA